MSSPTFAAVVLSEAAAAALTLLMALQLSAAASAGPPPPAIGLPNCTTTCGDVKVPYPFGISPGCYWPGLNLTCDRSHHPPRLLLGDGTLRVTEIFIENATVRVMRTGSIINTTGDFISNDWNVSFGGAFTEYGYQLSYANEFVVFGYMVMASLLAVTGEKTLGTISGCATFCTMHGPICHEEPDPMYRKGKYCGDSTSCNCCCQAGLSLTGTGGTPTQVQARWLYANENHTTEQTYAPVNVFLAEEGWVDQQIWVMGTTLLQEIPLILDWSVTQGLPKPQRHSCNHEVSGKLCQSEHSDCSVYEQQPVPGYVCSCKSGYDGNPYIPGGCQDINECNDRTSLDNSCFGDCNNLPGGYECLCPRGTHGNPLIPSGCISSRTGLVVGLSVASAPTLLLLAMGIVVVRRKIEQHRIQVLKQKYFKQNRGQLLQQLVSQKADITERMIIPVDELSKATNNFDKARELGGGGHGTVYKGILSDLHVVAIKKSKIAVQKEIDEFINEVAILSQINHRNVVKLHGCCLETEVPLLVYEFISNGTLYHHLHVEGPKSLSWDNRLRIATEIATSISYLHSAALVPIIHRDIKSSNILLDDTLTSKVSDFGASRYILVDQTEIFTSRVQGTIGYMDPICMRDGRLTEKSDVYSFGVILMELLTRKKPFSYLSPTGDNGLASYFAKLLAEGNLVQIIDPQVTEEGGEEVQQVAALATSCVNIRDEERPSMRQVEHALEGLWGTKKNKKCDTVVEDFQNQSSEVLRIAEATRRYSLEQEMMMSARYPR